jgi:Ca-activated chloride channel family protein
LPAFGQRSAEVTLADLERGAALSVLTELELGPRPPGSYRVARVSLVYDDATTGMTNQRMEEDLVFAFVGDRAQLASGANALVQRELEIARASRSLERTMMGLKTQQLSAGQAAVELERTQMFLASQGRGDQAQEVGEAIESLRRGAGDAEKTLIGAIIDLDQGKRSS